MNKQNKFAGYIAGGIAFFILTIFSVIQLKTGGETFGDGFHNGLYIGIIVIAIVAAVTCFYKGLKELKALKEMHEED